MPVAGRRSGFAITSTGGVSTLLNTWVKKVSFPHNADVYDVTVFGTRDKAFIPTLRSATIAIEGIWATTPDKLLSGILGTSQAFIYYPGTTAPTAGIYAKYSGTAICTKYEIPSDVTAAITFSADFQISGLVSRTTTV